MTTYYGNYGSEKYPLAVQIWGHRLRSGQHWIEYMLEFLSVMSGFGYQLGQGLPQRAHEPDYLPQYRVPRRLGLRRFVFYDEREKTRDTRDTRATDELRRRVGGIINGAASPASDPLIEQVRSLLRSFSAVESDRSWYAKSLFPVHEEFLLWEGQRKGATRNPYPHAAEQLAEAELDDGVEFSTRNFFARGGELYYLILSAGTEGRPEQRDFIGSRLRALLTQQNQSLGRIARTIDTLWSERGAAEGYIHGTLGWIPDPECALYRQIADDLATFLDNDLESLECLELLAHLIGFHIISYIYHRANEASHSEGHCSGSCLDACRPTLLVDLLGQQDGGVVRDRSARLLRDQDDRQRRQARSLVNEKVRAWAASSPRLDAIDDTIEDEADAFFQMGHTRARGSYTKAIGELRTRYSSAAPGDDRRVQGYSDAIFNALESEFSKNFLGVHRKLGKAIGLIAPRTGQQMRFVLGDTLLKTLMMAALPRGTKLGFGVFLERLYCRYGIVVGPGEAKEAGLIERLRINEAYYASNRQALLVRMKAAGLVTEYSDATALVRRA